MRPQVSPEFAFAVKSSIHAHEGAGDEVAGFRVSSATESERRKTSRAAWMFRLLKNGGVHFYVLCCLFFVFLFQSRHIDFITLLPSDVVWCDAVK